MTATRLSPTVAEFDALRDSVNQTYRHDTLSYTNAAYVTGGYVQIGKLVVINIRFKVTANNNVRIAGFPYPLLNIAVSAAKMSANAMLTDFTYLGIYGELNVIRSTFVTNDQIAVSVAYMTS